MKIDEAGILRAAILIVDDQESNVTLLERPIGRAPLRSVIRAALRARSRQYQLRDYLNDFLGRMHESGALYELQEKWFGQSFPDLPRVGLLPGDRPMPE